MIEKYSLIIILVIVAGCFFFFGKELGDRDFRALKDKYEEKRLEDHERSKEERLIILSLRDEIVAEMTKREQSEAREDSLIDYQNKIYVYYEKQINDFNSLPNDSLYSGILDAVRQYKGQ